MADALKLVLGRKQKNGVIDFVLVGNTLNLIASGSETACSVEAEVDGAAAVPAELLTNVKAVLHT